MRIKNKYSTGSKHKKVVLLAALAIGGLVYYVLSRDSFSVMVNRSSNPAAGARSNFAYRPVDACNILTPEAATDVLGDDAKKGNVEGTNASSDDVAVSTCQYYKMGSVYKGYQTVSVVARIAKTSRGSSQNKAAFTTNLPPDSVAVTGLGDTAYWDKSAAQLNVLAGNNWYKIICGSTVSAERTQEAARAFAENLQLRT